MAQSYPRWLHHCQFGLLGSIRNVEVLSVKCAGANNWWKDDILMSADDCFDLSSNHAMGQALFWCLWVGW